MSEHDELIGVARAIIGRLHVDWPNVESSSSDESLRATLRELKIIAEIADLHHSAAASPSTTPTSSISADSPASSGSEIDILAPSDPAATQWGPLRLLEHIADGSFGEVYRALDTRLDREVALKLLRRSDASGDSIGSSVIDEARLLARVRHPNVVTIYGADRIDGRVGLWMEFVRGRTLEQTLKERGSFDPDEVTALGTEICRALGAVHQAGLLHRDVKAHNVMQQDDGRLVLMDFGAGRELTEDGAAEDLAGTPLYLAPEIFEGQAATTRSDIYSVGVLLYHLVTGIYPVSGRTVREVREGHRSNRCVPLRQARADVPDQFAHLVERALEPDPKDRFAKADDLAGALAACLQSPVSAPPRTWLAAGAFLAALVALATAATLLNVDGLRDRLLGRPGQPDSPSAVRAGINDNRSLAVRQVLLPGEYSDLGWPSRDGRLFSFLDGTAAVAVKDLETGQVRSLVKGNDSEGYAGGRPRLSNDNRFVAYPWDTPDRAFELRVLELNAGLDRNPQPRILVHRTDAEIYPIEWSRDGSQILSLLETKTGTAQIALISVADGSVRSIKEFGATRPMGISLSFDGRFVIYDHPQSDNPRSRDIFVVATDGSGEWPLLEHPASETFPFWMPHADRVVFTSDRTGALGLWMVRVAGGRALGEPEVLNRDMGRMSPLGLTNGGAFFYRFETGLVDVYTASLDPSSGMVTGKPQPVQPNRVGSNISSNWSADGRYLAYVKISNPAGPTQGDPFSRALSIHDTLTGQERDLWPALAFFIAPRWAPDGRSILVNGQDLKRRGGLQRVDVESGGVKPAILSDDLNQVGWPRWISSETVAYQNRADPSIVARNLRNGTETTLATIKSLGVDRLTPGMQGTPFGISPDGRLLAFSGWIGSGANAYTVIRVMALGGVPTEIVRGPDGSAPKAFFFQAWTPDGLDLLFTKQEQDRRYSLWRISAQGGTPQPLGLEMNGLRDVHLSSDGTHLTFTVGSQVGDVRVMENFLPR